MKLKKTNKKNQKNNCDNNKIKSKSRTNTEKRDLKS